MKYNRDRDLPLRQIGIGETPEVNEKNDDFCVWQFNHHKKNKAWQVSSCNYVFPKLHIKDPQIERELKQIEADFIAGKYDDKKE